MINSMRIQAANYARNSRRGSTIIAGSAFGLAVLTVILIALTLPLFAYSGWVLSVVWSWFAMPLGLPAISWAHGAGIVLVIAWLTGERGPEKKEGESMRMYALGLFYAPTFVLALSWLLHKLM
jgi:hypothetical protein